MTSELDHQWRIAVTVLVEKLDDTLHVILEDANEVGPRPRSY